MTAQLKTLTKEDKDLEGAEAPLSLQAHSKLQGHSPAEDLRLPGQTQGLSLSTAHKAAEPPAVLGSPLTLPVPQGQQGPARGNDVHSRVVTQLRSPTLEKPQFLVTACKPTCPTLPWGRCHPTNHTCAPHTDSLVPRLLAMCAPLKRSSRGKSGFPKHAASPKERSPDVLLAEMVARAAL